MTIEENRNETGKQKKGSKNFIHLFIFFFSQEKKYTFTENNQSDRSLVNAI